MPFIACSALLMAAVFYGDFDEDREGLPSNDERLTLPGVD
jgi:hypothetical protein